jgi:NAD(P)-dependent dehydrogenase (short-subunit alcohol dehydrogenase family)
MTANPEPELLGQTVVVIGGSAGIGLELGASTVAFDATDFQRLGRFFDELPTPIDHVLVTGPGPYYAPLAEFGVAKARRDVDAHLLLRLQVARAAVTTVRTGATFDIDGGQQLVEGVSP